MNRILLSLGCFLCLSAHAQQDAQPSINIDPTFSRHGIQVITNEQKGFGSALASLIGKSVIDSTGALVPYLLIVTNGSSKPIVRAIVRLVRAGSDGQPVAATSSLDTGVQKALLPGRTVVLSPSTYVAQQIFLAQRHQPVDLNTLASRAAAAFDYLASPSRYSTTTLSLDSLVFEDSTVIGPDVFDVKTETASKAKAELAVIDRLLATSSTAEIVAWLKDQSEAQETQVTKRDGTRAPDPYQYNLKSFSRATLSHIENSGIEAITQMLAAYRQQLLAQSQLKKVDN